MNIKSKAAYSAVTLVDSIDIMADIQVVYNHFINRPNKLPSSPLLEAKPFFIIRALSTGSVKGFSSLILKSRQEIEREMLDRFKPGASFGPFQVISISPPFLVKTKMMSLLADMDIDWIFKEKGSGQTSFSMKVKARRDTFLRRIYVRLWQPLHHRMAQKMLAIYKKEVEIG